MACSARRFDLLRNAPHSSIRIHFGVALLVLTASLSSASLPKTHFDRLKKGCRAICSLFLEINS